MVILAMLISAVGCSSPSRMFDLTAASLGLEREVVTGTEFQHVLFWRSAEPKRRPLHVYLDGDGTPISGRQPSEDPTPRNTLMLSLLAQDPGPAVYVGRPCYHGMARALECSADLWTSARYSERVVSSLAAILNSLLQSGPYDGVSFFGHSGGGTLAMLLGERVAGTRAVVTLGANLDIDAWADLHGIPRLSASLNPAARQVPGQILQRHYVGSGDRIVPQSVVTSGIRAANAELIVVNGYDHLCCWTELWPTILADVATAEKSTSARF
jgi:hypothetical protein